MSHVITHEEAKSLQTMCEIIVRKHFRLPPWVCEEDDLIQVGLTGALEAAKRWTPDRGSTLRTYAHFRAYGAIQDHLRKIKPGSRYDKTEYKIASLDAPMLTGPDGTDELITLGHTMMAPDFIGDWDPLVGSALADAMEELPEKARLALWLAFCEGGWTRRDIGEVIGKSEAGTYQFIAANLRRLREHPALKGYDPSTALSYTGSMN